MVSRLAALEKAHFLNQGIVPWEIDSQEFDGAFRQYVEYDVARRTKDLISKVTRLALVNSIFAKVSERQGETKALKSNKLAVKRSIRSDFEAIVSLIRSPRVQALASEESFTFNTTVEDTWDVEAGVYDGLFPWVSNAHADGSMQDAQARRLANKFCSCVQQFQRAEEEVKLVKDEKELTLMLYKKQIGCLSHAVQEIDAEISTLVQTQYGK